MNRNSLSEYIFTILYQRHNEMVLKQLNKLNFSQVGFCIYISILVYFLDYRKTNMFMKSGKFERYYYV